MDLAILSANIFTGDPAMPRAQALAVKDGRIALVGTDAAVKAALTPQTTVLELPGRLVTPAQSDGPGEFDPKRLYRSKAAPSMTTIA